MGRAAAALWVVAASALAGAPPDYDRFSEPDGYIATKQQQAAAWELLHDPEQVEAVYADAVKGNVRAVHVAQQLEATLAASGVEVAERTNRPGCLAPVYKELSGTCRPDWSFLDFLSKDRPGGARLREVIFGAYAERARQRGLENQAILAAANGLLSVGLARSLLLRAEAGARPVAPSVLAAAERAGAVLPKPRINDPKLRNLVENLYKGTTNPNRVGTGTTADAVRAELATGRPTAGKFHLQKAEETIRGLQRWLQQNPNATYSDRLAAQSLLDELLSALGRSP